MYSNRNVLAAAVVMSILVLLVARASTGGAATDLFTDDLDSGDYAIARLVGEPAERVAALTRAVGEPVGLEENPAADVFAAPAVDAVTIVATVPSTAAVPVNAEAVVDAAEIDAPAPVGAAAPAAAQPTPPPASTTSTTAAGPAASPEVTDEPTTPEPAITVVAAAAVQADAPEAGLEVVPDADVKNVVSPAAVEPADEEPADEEPAAAAVAPVDEPVAVAAAADDPVAAAAPTPAPVNEPAAVVAAAAPPASSTTTTSSAPAAPAQEVDGEKEGNNVAKAAPAAPAASTTTTTTTTTSIAPTPAQPTPPAAWCSIEVRSEDGVIVWEDGGDTAVFRRNGNWFHTPDPEAQAVLINERPDTSDEYVLRLWADDDTSRDITCTFVELEDAPAESTTTTSSTTTSTTTTTTTTTAAPANPGAMPTPIGIPGGRVQMGFNVDLWGQDRTNYWNDLEDVPGNGTLIAHEFKSFHKSLSMDLYRWHISEGRDLLLTWNGTDATSILNGSQDAWIRDHARQLKTLPDTVMLRFWHEPDVRYKRHWIDDDPQQFIDSWMHVRQIFVEEGAVDNIEWVWCPTAWNWENQGARYYPGDANVDWICADGYSGWDHDKPLPPIEEAYTDFQAWADTHPSKPILIAEFGATQRGPGERAEWVRGIPSWVNASSNIRAVVYFDYDRRPNGEDYDWRLRTEPDAWAAMMDVLSSSPFG